AVRDQNKEPEVRRAAVEALGHIGTEARGAVGPLVQAIKGGPTTKNKKGPPDTADIRMELATALGKIASAKDEEAVKALEMIAGAKGKNKTLQSAANEALRKIRARK